MTLLPKSGITNLIVLVDSDNFLAKTVLLPFIFNVNSKKNRIIFVS